MFEPTSYSENRYVASRAALAGANLPTSTVSTVANITAVSGRFVQGSGSEALATLYNAGGVLLTTPSPAFTKPPTITDTVKNGTCAFMVHNVPPNSPYFDLELTLLRTAGVQRTANITLNVLNGFANGAPVLASFTGYVTIPAASPVPTVQLVQWTDGDPIVVQTGTEHLVPSFSIDALRLTHNLCTLMFQPPTPWMRSFRSCPSGSHSTRDHSASFSSCAATAWTKPLRGQKPHLFFVHVYSSVMVSFVRVVPDDHATP